MDNKTTTDNVLVTGGAGFIGANFIHFILENRPDLRVINLDALTYTGNLTSLAVLPIEHRKRHTFVHGDIRDADLLAGLFSQYSFKGIIHFAAESHVDRSIHGPQVFVDTNVGGTCTLLQASLDSWERRGRPADFRFHRVSTDEVYGRLGPVGAFAAKSPYDPSSPYSASKAASDHLVRSYGKTYGLPFVITNCSNNFYFPDCERGIIFSDPQLAVSWPEGNFLLSPKDQHFTVLQDIFPGDLPPYTG